MKKNEQCAFVNACIIDGSLDSVVIKDGALIINGDYNTGRIEKVGNRDTIQVPADYRVYDLKGKYIIPGLINAHAHITGDGKPRNLSTLKQRRRLMRMLKTAPGKKWALGKIRGNVTNALHSGVTTIRSAGDPHAYDLIIRQEVLEGKLPGPRIFSGGQAICPSGGHMEYMAHIADSPWEARRAVRKSLHMGVDYIKITSTGGVMDSLKIGEAGRPEMTLDEITAVCDEAHRAGVKVASHVHSTLGMKEALMGGVDTIEHGALFDKESTELFKKNPNALSGYSALVSTITVIINLSDYDGRFTRFSEVQHANAKIVRDRMIGAFRQCLENGIKIGLGTDSGVALMPHYDMWKELVNSVEYGGITPRHAIYLATKSNAEILGIDDETGTIEPGKSADFIVLNGNPEKDLNVLSSPYMVVCHGNVIENPRVKRVKDIDAVFNYSEEQ